MNFVEQRLIVGCSSSQSEELDALQIQVDFRADQSMDPVVVHEESVSQDFQRAVAVGASEKDDFPRGLGLQVQTPVVRDWSSGRSRLDADGAAFSGSGDVSPGALLEVVQTGVLEPIPDLGLPASVEAFDGRLESGFVGDRKDRHHVQTQAHPDDSTDGIGMLTGPGETIVVVELRTAWQPPHPPMFEQGLDDRLGGDFSFRPGDSQASMQGNSRQNGQMRSALNGESFDGVEAIQFAGSAGDLGQIPTGRGRRSSHTFAAVEQSVTFEDASEGSAGRQGVDSSLEIAPDGLGAILPQRAVDFEPFACGENLFLDCRGSASCLLGGTGTVLPFDAIQAFAVRMSDPVLHRGQGDGEAFGDRAHRLPAPNCSDHLATLCGREFFEPLGSREKVLEAGIPSRAANANPTRGRRGRPWGSGTPVGLRPPSVTLMQWFNIYLIN